MDWHRGRLSSRRLAVLIRHLPRDCAVVRETEGEIADWSVTDYLLAHAVDQLAEANWMFAMVNQDEDSDPLEFPKPIPRPNSTGSDQAASEPDVEIANPSAQELAAFFS
ncbi:hypothetical protein P8605_05905 [Streptomyces sp. T-3]|nr:hypothetical protein [Streptomyces sp. T-3]